jgi:RecB family exonuclease
MDLRQSDLKAWARCPLSWRYQHIDKLPRTQSGSAVFGTLLHDCVLYMESMNDLDGAIKRFHSGWLDPVGQLGQEKGQIDYYERYRSWKKFAEMGPRILRDWWSIIRWEADTVIAREHEFDVPIGNGHRLHGTADKIMIRFVPKLNTNVLVVCDYKTNAKTPTYDYLADDLQFTAYAYASLRPEFWARIPNGWTLYRNTKDLPRYGEWVHLQTPRRIDAGPRDTPQYNRLVYAINQMAESVAMRIFVPNISGETCKYCEFRDNCGLPEVIEEAPKW